MIAAVILTQQSRSQLRQLAVDVNKIRTVPLAQLPNQLGLGEVNWGECPLSVESSQKSFLGSLHEIYQFADWSEATLWEQVNDELAPFLTQSDTIDILTTVAHNKTIPVVADHIDVKLLKDSVSQTLHSSPAVVTSMAEVSHKSGCGYGETANCAGGTGLCASSCVWGACTGCAVGGPMMLASCGCSVNSWIR